MNWAQVFWNNIASLALIPVVIVIVLKIKNAQIDSLKEQNQVLRENIQGLERFRVGVVEKDFEALKKLYERKAEQLDETIKELGKKSLGEEQAELIVELFDRAIDLIRVPSPLRPTMATDRLSQRLYMMQGPIGELWRQRADGGKRWRRIQESRKSLRRKAGDKESGASI